MILEFPIDQKPVWTPQTAYMTLDMMHGNAIDNGAFSLRADIDGRYVAGKTGLSGKRGDVPNGESDIWFVGLTPGMVATVWIGFDDGSSIPKKIAPELTRAGDGIIGSSRQPIYIWREFVEEALRGKDVPAEFPVPDGIEFKHIDLTTGEVGGTRVALPISTKSEIEEGLERAAQQNTELEQECSAIVLSEYVGAECLTAIQERLEQIKTLKTYQEKSEALIALVPMLPQSGSLYSEYLQIASFLPEDLKQDAIAALSATLNADEGFLNYSDNYEPVHVHYPKEAMTVISEDGVAIIEFFDYFTTLMGGGYPNGSAYRYRLLEKGSSEEKFAEGIVFENYQEALNDEDNLVNLEAS